MSFWSVLGDILGLPAVGSTISGLFGLGSSFTSAKMEYSQTEEGQKRQYEYNTKLNKQQYKYQKGLNKDQYSYQTKLNKTAFDYQNQLNKTANQYARGLMQYENQLTTAQNQWNAVNLPSLNRQGYENAGLNPMLAIGSQSPAQMIPATGVSGGSASAGSAQGGSASGSSVSGAQGAKLDLLRGITDAYRTFQLEKELNKADVKLKEAQTEKVLEEKKLLKYDKPLKLAGDIIEDIKSSPKPIATVKGVLADTVNNARNGLNGSVNSAKKQFKNNLSKLYWKANDYIGDKVLYFDHYRRYGFKGHPSWKTYDGSLTKYRRINEGVYHYKQQKW